MRHWQTLANIKQVEEGCCVVDFDQSGGLDMSHDYYSAFLSRVTRANHLGVFHLTESYAT